MKKPIIIFCILFHGFQAVHGQAVSFICVNYMQNAVTQGYDVNFSGYSGANPILWEWDFANGDTGNLQVEGSFFPYPGIYPVKLKVTHAGGMQDSCINTLYVDANTILCYYTGPTGLEYQERETLNIFPNPCENVLSIKNITRNTEIEIFSLFGNSLYKQIAGESEITIHLEFLKCGIYFLKYSEMKEERMLKFVKQ